MHSSLMVQAMSKKLEKFSVQHILGHFFHGGKHVFSFFFSDLLIF